MRGLAAPRRAPGDSLKHAGASRQVQSESLRDRPWRSAVRVMKLLDVWPLYRLIFNDLGHS